MVTSDKEVIFNEAERIVSIIIKKRKHSMDSVKLIDYYMKPEFYDNRIEVHAYIPKLLARAGFTITCTDPLIIKKY